jgi:hypothetical protein
LQARYRRDRADVFNGTAFAVENFIHAFSISEAHAMCRHVAAANIETNKPERSKTVSGA